MSTHSILGTLTETTFEGIYADSDGQPTAMVPHLAAIATRDGQAGVEVLTGTRPRSEGGRVGSWDFISEHMPAADTPLPQPTHIDYLRSLPSGPQGADAGLTALYTIIGLLGSESEARERIAAGYGLVRPPRRGAWFGGDVTAAPPTGQCEWAYLFTSDLDLVVYELAEGMIERERFTRAELADLAEGDEALGHRVREAEFGAGLSR